MTTTLNFTPQKQQWIISLLNQILWEMVSISTNAFLLITLHENNAESDKK